MSGGSYNYLCYQEFPDIFLKQSDLRDMADRLTELGYKDAAKETEKLMLDIDAIELRIEAKIERLQNVWHAVEWKDSGDSGIEQVEKAINEYRNQ